MNSCISEVSQQIVAIVGLRSLLRTGKCKANERKAFFSRVQPIVVSIIR
jgi:hypothetical protein